MLPHFKTYNKVDILENLLDCSEKPLTPCVVNKTKQKIIPFILMQIKNLTLFCISLSITKKLEYK